MIIIRRTSIFSLVLFFLLFCNLFSKDTEPLCAYLSNNKWHILDHKGREILTPFPALEVVSWTNGYLKIAEKEGDSIKWVFKRLDGEVAFEARYDMIGDFSEGFALAINDTKGGIYEQEIFFIDTNGNLLKTYSGLIDATDFSEGIAYIKTLTKRGYIDKTGNYKFFLDTIVGFAFKEGLAPVNNKSYMMGYINHEGKIEIELKFDEAHPFYEGLAFVHVKGKCGYINKNGEYAIPLKYEDGKMFKEGRAWVAIYDRINTLLWGIINNKGEEITDFIYVDRKNFSEGLSACKKDSLWGFVDKNGIPRIDFKYNLTDYFKNGLAWVYNKESKEYGYINKDGKFEIIIEAPIAVVDLRTNRRVL